MTFSSDSGSLQLFLVCHCMGLMCSLPTWTCFSVAVSRAIKDMNCWTKQAGWDRTLVFFAEGSTTGPALTFPNLPANLGSDIFELIPVYARDKFGGIWLSPTCRLGTGGSLYPCAWSSGSPPLVQQ